MDYPLRNEFNARVGKIEHILKLIQGRLSQLTPDSTGDGISGFDDEGNLTINTTDGNSPMSIHDGDGTNNYATTFDASQSISFKMPVNEALIPYTTASNDLGSSSNKWKNAYINGAVNAASLSLTGNIKAVIPVYASDSAADADSALTSGSLYRITGGRGVFQKP